MLNLWKILKQLLTSVLKILEISASFYYVYVTIPPYIPICDSVFLGLSYFFQDGLNKVHVRPIYLLANNLPMNKNRLPKWCHCVHLDQTRPTCHWNESAGGRINPPPGRPRYEKRPGRARIKSRTLYFRPYTHPSSGMQNLRYVAQFLPKFK